MEDWMGLFPTTNGQTTPRTRKLGRENQQAGFGFMLLEQRLLSPRVQRSCLVFRKIDAS